MLEFTDILVSEFRYLIQITFRYLTGTCSKSSLYL